MGVQRRLPNTVLCCSCRLVHSVGAVAFLIIALFLSVFRPAGLVQPPILLRLCYFPFPLSSSLPFPPKERQPNFTSVSAIIALDETSCSYFGVGMPRPLWAPRPGPGPGSGPSQDSGLGRVVCRRRGRPAFLWGPPCPGAVARGRRLSLTVGSTLQGQHFGAQCVPIQLREAVGRVLVTHLRSLYRHVRTSLLLQCLEG